MKNDAIHHAIDIAAAPDRIWRVFCDLSTWPSWFPRCARARFVDGAGALPAEATSWRVGGHLAVELAVPVVGTIAMQLELLEVEPARRVRWVGKAYGIEGDHTYTFEPRGAWTRVTSHETFGGWMAGVARRMAGGRIDDEVHRSMDKLRALVEAGG